ncbi:hypothetical protein BU14_0125s0052 [Porphyra umbilicalis]|uniref:Uncharacterized protein n=1 Tax=Porphyra umbilicalis TaxID=2786 RepID=A0A1X6PB40_PORUM|nr:hypothetical protein BU14_0125s0052 [Porphyra umbilicalis]|eukprot:OSX78064.1 hypothetical protein BU14_0125s0052 [Porphyra umbilicalis]
MSSKLSPHCVRCAKLRPALPTKDREEDPGSVDTFHQQ